MNKKAADESDAFLFSLFDLFPFRLFSFDYDFGRRNAERVNHYRRRVGKFGENNVAFFYLVKSHFFTGISLLRVNFGLFGYEQICFVNI